MHSCEFFGEGLCARRLLPSLLRWCGAHAQALKGGGASFGTSSDSFSLPALAAKHIFDVIFSLSCRWLSRATSTHSQLSAMDVSVRSTMKGAAKCDKHCELQNSVNRQGLERILCFWDIPESMPASVSTLCCSSSCSPLRGMLLVISCASGRALSALLRCSMDKAPLRQPAY